MVSEGRKKYGFLSIKKILICKIKCASLLKIIMILSHAGNNYYMNKVDHDDVADFVVALLILFMDINRILPCPSFISDPFSVNLWYVTHISSSPPDEKKT